MAMLFLMHVIGPAALIDWTKTRIARFKAPTSITVVDRLPRNALGKVLKHQVRADQLAAAGETP